MMLEKTFLLLLCISIFTVSNEIEAQRKSIKKDFPIRVLIAKTDNDIVYNVTEPVYLFCSNQKTALIKRNNSLRIHASGRSFELSIKDKVFQSNSFRLEPADSNATLLLGGREYEGALQFQRTDSYILTINIVPFEKYINGVVSAELGRPDSQNIYCALEAQAICARSFALMKLGEMNGIYDVESTTQSQVYFGKGNYPEIKSAVEQTEGQIITYDDEPAVVFYHSCCGGLTENVENVFSSGSYPYLTSGVDGEPAYCANSPVFAWREEYTLEDIRNYLKDAGLLQTRFNEKLLSIEITKRFPSGRSQEIAFNFQDGTTALVKAPAIRNIIRRKSNGGILRSSFINIKLITNDNTEQKIVIDGRGNGHGVGFCQWGAFTMARKGLTTKQILEHYFPGTGLRNIYD